MHNKTAGQELPSGRLALEHLTLNKRLQCRALKPSVVNEYAKAMRSGAEFPPVSVVLDGKGRYYLVDGHHRVAATQTLNGIDHINVQIVRGTFSDALWLSWGANLCHGLPRTREAKRRAIQAALRHPKWRKQSDRAIARHVGCDNKTVAAFRWRLGREEFLNQESGATPTVNPQSAEKQILRACRLLIQVQVEKALSFGAGEMAEVTAGYECLARFLDDAETAEPQHGEATSNRKEAR